MKTMPNGSRAKNRAALVLLIASAALALLLPRGWLALALVLGLIAAAGVLLLSANRCPYCGTVFRGLYWSKPTAGHCGRCGKMIVFDDAAP
ncbi:MAG: hypothetical protein Q4F17_08200 [Eubacteriales bacterium]|nr:hypothetical protein [Eubacteriales bacterium]